MSRIRQYRRGPGEAPGAPASLLSGEIHYNMADGFWRGGFGDDGEGNATSIKKFARDDFFQNLPAAVDGKILAAVDGEWVAADAPEGSLYTASGNGIELAGTQFTLNYAEIATGISLDNYATKANPTFTGVVTVPTAAPGDSSTKAASTSFVQTALETYAPLASPALSGNPTAPTQAPGNNTTRLATTAFVSAAVQALVGMSPAELDTLAEIATAIQQGVTNEAAIVASVATKLSIAQNLADVEDVGQARINLGLGTMATQAANNVAITGGTIENVILDAGSDV